MRNSWRLYNSRRFPELRSALVYVSLNCFSELAKQHSFSFVAKTKRRNIAHVGQRYTHIELMFCSTGYTWICNAVQCLCVQFLRLSAIKPVAPCGRRRWKNERRHIRSPCLSTCLSLHLFMSSNTYLCGRLCDHLACPHVCLCICLCPQIRICVEGYESTLFLFSVCLVHTI
jgi:hypothetical protein